MKRLISPLAALLVGASLAATAQAASDTALDAFKGQKGTLDIAGGTAHIPVMKKAAQAIMESNPGIRITVAGGGSGVGVQKVGEGLVQIGNTGRALKASEIEKYGLRTFPFAIDGVAVVVNPGNPVSAMSKQQLKDVFAGRIVNWKARPFPCMCAKTAAAREKPLRSAPSTRGRPCRGPTWSTPMVP